MNLFALTDRQAVLVDILAWIALGTLIGYLGHRLPVRWLARDRGALRLRGFESGGTWYERRLGIKRWKDRLPEAGAVFGGGVSKRRLSGHRPEDLLAFAAETRRAEVVHWGLLLSVPLFALWNPWPLFAVMAVYAVAANGPCLLVQRYNRARVAAVLARVT